MIIDCICPACENMYLRFSPGFLSCPYCCRTLFSSRRDFIREATELILNFRDKNTPFIPVSRSDFFVELLLQLYEIHDEFYMKDPFETYLSRGVNKYLPGTDEVIQKSIVRAGVIIFDNINSKFREKKVLPDFL